MKNQTSIHLFIYKLEEKIFCNAIPKIYW